MAHEEEDPKKKINFLKIFISISLALMIAIVGLSFSAYTVFSDKLKTQSIKVPDVTEMNIYDAKELLNEAGFFIEIYGQNFSSVVDSGSIIEQSHKAGTFLKEGYIIKVSISKGENLVMVPKLTGKEENQAEVLLENAGLKVGNIIFEQNDLPKGYVIDQSPTNNTEVRVGSVVNLVVSKGMALNDIIVPNLIGKTYLEAKDVMNAVGIISGNIEYAFSEEFEKDHIITQSLNPGETTSQGTTLSFTISKGSELEFEEEIVEEDPTEITSDLISRTLLIPADFEEETQLIKVVVVYEGVEDIIYAREHTNQDSIIKVSIEVKSGSVVNIYYGENIVNTMRVE